MTTTTRPACPHWCDSATSPGHWTPTRDGLEVLHTRRFGPVTVNLYVETYSDGTTSTAAPDLVIRNAPHMQQIDGETVLTSAEGAGLAELLTDAARFAHTLEQETAR